MAKQESTNNGIGLCGATFIAFLVLKLMGIINWSWWWVTAPLWGPPALLLVAAAVCFAIGAWQIRKRK